MRKEQLQLYINYLLKSRSHGIHSDPWMYISLLKTTYFVY